MEKDIVVVDTCVWLSAVLSNKIDRFIKLSARHRVTVFTCPEMMDEITRNLFDSDYFLKHVKNQAGFLEEIRKLTFNQTIDKRFDRAADAKDNFLFDLAYTVKSHYLVTSDKPLLNMKHVGEIQLIAPAAYFRLFKMKW